MPGDEPSDTEDHLVALVVTPTSTRCTTCARDARAARRVASATAERLTETLAPGCSVKDGATRSPADLNVHRRRSAIA